MSAATVSLIITAISAVYQHEQARKMRAAADAKKGQFIAVEGQVVALPIAYGRVLIGGARVYHTTSSRYSHTSPPEDSDVFLGGVADGSSYTVTQDTENGPVDVVMPATPGTVLDQDREGTKNEFLFVQQALCIGPINKCYDVVIDDVGTYNREEYKQGLKIVVHREGNVADTMSIANSPAGDARELAKFPNAAYASMCFRLNRDEPQFNGVPNVTFIIEGRKVRPIILSGGHYGLGERIYSNNPALCLLDYLMDDDYGRSLDESEIDLASFYQVSLICNRSIPTTDVSGKIWQTTKPVNSGGRAVTSMQFPMFESNILLDTSKSIRENVKSLLSTMGDARLIWSGGKYKLVLNYPHIDVNSPPPIAAVITDNELVRESVEIQWPNLDTRKNYCTVRFYNEAKDFKEDTATWPTRFGDVHMSYLLQDNNIPLETDVQGQGISTKVHATAKAEELVRASRNAVSYTFSIVLKDTYFEPGDIVKVESDALQTDDSDLYLQIDEISLSEEGVAKVKAVRFVPEELAWNVDDNAENSSGVLYVGNISKPTNLVFTPKSEIPKSERVLGDISGQLSWTAPFDSRVVGFKLYAGKAGELGTTVDAEGNTVSSNTQKFVELGTALQSPFDVPELEASRYVFGARSVTAYGGMSEMTTLTTSALIHDEPLPAPISLDATPLYFAIKLTWSQPTLDGDRYAYTEIYRNSTGLTPVLASNIITNAIRLGVDAGGVFQDTNPTKDITFFYWAVNVTKRGTRGQPSSVASAEVKSDPDELLGLLTGVITEEQLWGSLVERINIIDMPNVGLVSRVDELFSTLGSTLNASESAANALISRNEAATFSTNASNSAASAHQSELIATSAATNAGSSANAAAGAATAASISQQAAATSATTATEASSLAVQKATVATTAATTATEAALAANNSSLSAATSEAGALSHKQSAFNSATTATEAAATATTNATIATQASNTATTKAGEAVNSATAAYGYKNDAASSAATALGAQSASASSAGVASAAALTATNKAGEAQTYAADAGVKRDEAAQSAVTAAGHATASAQSYTTINARLNNAGGTGISIEQGFNAHASSISGLSGQYTVKIDNNGYVSGFGFASESSVAGGSTSTFAVRADKFALGAPGGGSYVPFIVTTTPTTDSYGNTIPAGVYMDNVTITRGNIQKGTIAASFGGSSAASSGSFSFYVGAGGADVVMSVGFAGYMQLGSGKGVAQLPCTGYALFPGGAYFANASSCMSAVTLPQGWHSISYSLAGSTPFGSALPLSGASASFSAAVLYR